VKIHEFLKFMNLQPDVLPMAGDKIAVVQKSCLKARKKVACFDIKKVARHYALC
jgi:hypothetical protein